MNKSPLFKKIEALQGLLIESGSSQETIYLNKDSFLALQEELLPISRVDSFNKLTGVVTDFGPIKVESSDGKWGIDLLSLEIIWK